MSENSTLHIHTQLPPEAAEVIIARKGRERKGGRGFPLSALRAPLPLTGARQGMDSGLARHQKGERQGMDPDLARPREKERQGMDSGLARPREGESCHGEAAASAVTERRPSSKTHASPSAPKPRRASRATKPRLSFPERLLRNSAIACAVLLAVLALGNVREPWAQKASEGVRRALTMRINLDDSLGELTFVRSLMPESALVFLNVSGGDRLARPVDAAVSHPWSRLQPWTMFDGAGEAVRSAGAGTVTAVSALSGGGYGVLVDHGEGLESVYANLAEVSVRQGDSVNRGDALGTVGEGLYFELRERGEPVDPTERLGL